jgi:diguanylate cyclase (GGDEF)-like protein
VENEPGQAQPELAPEQIESKIQALDWRDLQLWCIGAVVLAVIAAGFLAIISPEILWQATAVVGRQGNIEQLFFGLIALMFLLNIYLFQQRLGLLRTRRELIHQLQVAERTARTDALTGVYNRRFMREALTREVARAERNHSRLSIMFADVDKFKDFNTRFGHLTGDRVLIDVATVLRKNFRSADLVTRYGGDEFLVIMPDTDLVQAGVAGERLVWWIDRWNDKQQRGYRISVTCGVATYIPGMDIEQLLCAADSDLYLQKANCPGNKQHPAGRAFTTPRL